MSSWAASVLVALVALSAVVNAWCEIDEYRRAQRRERWRASLEHLDAIEATRRALAALEVSEDSDT